MKLPRDVEDSVVEKRLEHAVAHAFTVLQNLFEESSEHEKASISPRFVACAALFLHLQDSHCKERLGAWQPFCVQHKSARATTASSTLKRYISSDVVGEDDRSPLSGFPRCVAHLTSTLDPEMHPVATPPVLCWLCGAGFCSHQSLYRHTREAHGDYAEYRKRLFWVAQERGPLPLLPWQKRHMLSSLSFFQCFSIPESGAMEWTEERSVSTAEQRQEIACAICARKDWQEHRYRVYLWREPEETSVGDGVTPETVLQNPSVQEELGDAATQGRNLTAGRAPHFLRTMNEGLSLIHI